MPAKTDKISCIAVDDNELFLMKLTTFLNEIPQFHLLGKFSNPIQGATAIVQKRPDLLFLDLEMPYMDGYSLIDWILPMLRQMEKKPKIIIISGNSEIMDLEHPDILTHIQKEKMKTPEDLIQALNQCL